MKIRIKDTNSRRLLFDSLKGKNGLTWKEIGKIYGIPKSTFEKYRNGQWCMKGELFSNLLSNVDKDIQNKVMISIEELPDNFGLVLGGKNAYLINRKKFDIGRKEGLSKLAHRRNLLGRQKVKYSFETFQLNTQICEVIGAFIGDGCFNCYKNKVYHIEFAGDSRKDLQYYQDIIIPAIKAVMPKVKPHIYKVRDRNSIRIVFYSKEFFYFLKEVFGFIPGKKTYTVSIPNKIISANDLFIRSTIRGIFDTDGCVFFDKRKAYKSYYPRVTLHTKSGALHQQLQNYLSKEFSLYSKFNQKKQVYVIEVYGKEQFKKWMSLVGFSNRRHLERIASVVQR